ncbi:sulfite exporter TauE/SafE family protein [Colwellia sp. MEBiC06753]
MTIEWLILYLVLGSVVGFTAGLLGVGGGGIMVPILTSMFIAQGVPADKVVHLALGTSMACIVFTSIASLRAHHRNNAVIWPIVGKMAIGIIIGTFVATFLAAYLSSTYLAIFFAGFMTYVAFNSFIKTSKPAIEKPITPANIAIASTSIGAISALVSIGGGSLTVPYLSSKAIPLKKAIGTSAAVGFPIAVSGTLGYLINGWQVDYQQLGVFGFIYMPAVIIIALVSFFTAPIGAKLAHALPVAILKKIFAVLLVGLAAKMLLSVL